MSTEATVYVVDDDADVRDSLKLLLQTLNFRVEVFSTARDFLTRESHGRACLLTDLRMPDMDGLELQQEVNRRRLGIPVVIMTAHGDVPLAVRAMKAGAVDFLEKPFEESALIASVERALAAGQRSVAQESQSRVALERVGSLTAREREVFELVAAGKPNKVVADELNISQRTVEIHRAHVMDKLAARNLADVVRIWLDLRKDR
jgi:two-component system response regulator FixJ